MTNKKYLSILFIALFFLLKFSNLNAQEKIVDDKIFNNLDELYRKEISSFYFSYSKRLVKQENILEAIPPKVITDTSAYFLNSSQKWFSSVEIKSKVFSVKESDSTNNLQLMNSNLISITVSIGPHSKTIIPDSVINDVRNPDLYSCKSISIN